MPEEIQEVPLDIPEIPPDIESEIAPPEIETVLSREEELPPSKPKAKPKGRPKGSPNKVPSKPHAKKVAIQEESLETALAPPVYEPSSPRRNLQIPEFGVNDVAVEMLRLLSNQQQARQQRKRDLYKSWFN